MFTRPTDTFWRCHQCRRGLMTSRSLRLYCPVCGGRHLAPIHTLTVWDRVQMAKQGINPLTRHIPDREVL